MAKITSTLTIATLLGLCLHVAPAQAQLARTFVSSIGSDANDCNRVTPCRTFQRAHNQTLSLGEITVLDPGGYGAVTITKGISIINDGVGEAGVLVSGGATGITINAGADDHVSLRGLTVKGIGFGGGNGVVFNSGKSLTIENCAIRNLTGASPLGNGIIFQPNASSSLAVANTLVADNDNDGITIVPTVSGFVVTAVFSRVEAYNNGGNGFLVDGSSLNTGTINATVADSVAANNVRAFSAVSQTGHATTSLMVIRSVVANNGIGILAGSAAVTVWVGQSTITGNLTSWRAVGSLTVQSFGDNYIAGNLDDDPAPPTIAKK